MPKRTVLQSIIVGRGEKRITPAIGEVFDFTDDELKSLPEGAVSEMATVSAADVPLEGEQKTKGGKKAEADL